MDGGKQNDNERRIREGKLFTDECEGLPEERMSAKIRMWKFNHLMPDETEKRSACINEIFGKETDAWIEPPFYFCYGTHITVGVGTYINMNCNFIDDGSYRSEKMYYLALPSRSRPWSPGEP